MNILLSLIFNYGCGGRHTIHIYFFHKIFLNQIFFSSIKTYTRISRYRFIYFLLVYNVTIQKNPFIPYVPLCIKLNRTSIVKLSFKEDKNNSGRSHKVEIIKNIMLFCKDDYTITPSVRESDMTNQLYLKSSRCISFFVADNQTNSTRQKDNLVKIMEVENPVESGLCYPRVPVESFERSSTGTSC